MSAGAPPPPARSRYLDGGLLAAGVVLFAALLLQFGLDTVAAHLAAIGFGFLLVVAQELLAYVANTVGWWTAFRKPRPPLPPWRLLEARIVGDAFNYLTPTAGLGGELVRARCLRDLAPAMDLAASISVAKLTQLAGQIAFLAVGLLLVLPTVSLPPPWHAAASVGLAGALALVGALVVLQRRGLFAPLLRFMRRLGFVREHHGIAEFLARLDVEIAAFHRDEGRGLAASAAAFALGWALGLVEVALLLWLLDVEVTLARVVAIEVLAVAFDSVLFFVPAKAGTQEAGKVLIFGALGLDPALGLAFGIARRVREMSWAGIGMLLWWRRQAALSGR